MHRSIERVFPPSTRAFTGAVLVFALALAATGEAAAQAWPVKPVKFLVAQPAGAGPDIMARFLADRLGQVWGQSVVVENRPGGASIPGTVAAVKAPPDGYTYYMATGGVLLNAYTFKKLPYDPDKDLVPVALIGLAPFLLLTNPSLPVASVGELVAYLKANPGKVVFASEGPRNLGGLMTDMLKVLTGTSLLHVPYNGAAAGIQATVAGEAQAAFQSATASSPLVRSGRLRALAVTTARPIPGLESVPPLKASYPEFEYAGWYMLYAPTGTPAGIVARVNRDLDRILTDPAVSKRLFELGPIVEGAGTPASLAEFHREEHARWKKLVQLTGFVAPD